MDNAKKYYKVEELHYHNGVHKFEKPYFGGEWHDEKPENETVENGGAGLLTLYWFDTYEEAEKFYNENK